jgi:hypothetical protein
MSENIPSLASPEVVEELAKKVLDVVTEKITKQFNNEIITAFYDNMEDYLSEHHSNFEDKIIKDVFDYICGEGWTRFKDRPGADKLRCWIYQQHKGEIEKQLGKQIFEENEALKERNEQLETENRYLRQY